MVLRAGFHGTVGQSSAQVIDGSLKFNANTKNQLKRTFSDGNRTTWTLSAWVKRNTLAATHTDQVIFEANGSNDDNNFITIKFRNATVSDSFNISGASTNFIITNQQFRDVSSWYNIVVSANTGEASADRLKVYVNGERITSFNTYNAPSGNTGPNGAVAHHIGYGVADDQPADVNMSQYYFIDGAALGPGFFGFNDPLTGTWRPKRLRQGDPTVNDGTTWSSVVTATGSGAVSGINGSYPVTNAFDGDTSTYLSTAEANISSNPAILTVTFPAGKEPSFSSDVVVYVGGSTSDTLQISFNGSPFKTVANPSTGLMPHTFATGTGKINEIKVSRQKSNTNDGGAYISSIFVDGVQLIDNTTTNVDFGTNGFYLPWMETHQSVRINQEMEMTLHQ